MANEPKVEKEVAPVAPKPDGLVKMQKFDEFIRVHPTCVNSHKAAGWKVCE